MTEQNPPLWMQGGTYPAVNDRQLITAAFPMSGSATTLGGGVVQSDSHKVTPSSGMNLSVAGGHSVILGSDSSGQGSYLCFNNGAKVVAIPTANATNPRIDLVVGRIRDNAYIGGGSNTYTIEVIQGTAAPSPTVPTKPASSVILAQVSVPAGDTVIDAGQIADLRVILPVAGGIGGYYTNTSPDLTVEGQLWWDRDADRLLLSDGTGVTKPAGVGKLYACITSRSTASGSWSSGTWSSIPMGTEDYDPEGMHAASNSFHTILRAGWYEIDASVEWSTESTGSRSVGAHVGGAWVSGPPNGPIVGPIPAAGSMRLQTRRLVLCAAGDVVTLVAWHNNGASTGVVACRLETSWVGTSV